MTQQLSLFLLALFFLTCAQANSTPKGDLQRLQDDIKQLSQTINETSNEKKQEEQLLSVIEKEISNSIIHLRSQNQVLSELEQSLNELRKQKEHHQTKLAQQKTRLRELIIRQYTQGTDKDLKLLLNQDNPLLLDRTIIYQRYLNEAHASLINDVKEIINNLERTEEKITLQRNSTQQAKEQFANSQRKLEQQRAERQEILKRIETELNEKNQHMITLQQNEERLKETVRQLSLNPVTQQNKSLAFVKLKGSLPWPIKGKAHQSYGNKKGTGSLKWQGILIRTPTEQDVKSIAAGKVVFSDWLMGFGMLIIIDHGNDYISLYGQNQTLFKEVGDLVEQQDIIASVAADKDSGLYFELRHKGKPINPSHWLSK